LVSLALHSLLALLLFAGAGFLRSSRQTEGLPTITFIPSRLIDAQIGDSGGPPPTTPPTPALRVAPEPAPSPPLPSPVTPPAAPETIEQPLPEPPKPEVKLEPKPPRLRPSPKPEPEQEPPREAKPEPKAQRQKAPPPPAKTPQPPKPAAPPKRVIEPNLNLTVRTAPRSAADERAQAEAAARAQEAAQAREREAALARARQAAEARRERFSGAVSALQQNLSGSTDVSALGQGGETYANYGVFVKSVFDAAWRPPEEAAEDAATVKVKVVIARDGTILSTEILSRSGHAALDKSVRAALQRVESIGQPFPEGAVEDRRVFIINFNLKAKRSLG
jgi:TonB family protein